MEVFVDDVLVGTTPLDEPVAVNEGRRKIDVVTGSGEHRTRQIDVAGGEVVRASFPRLAAATGGGPAAAAARAATAAANLQPAEELRIRRADDRGDAPRRAPFPWKSWTLTGVLAAGAATTGAIALMAKRDLDQQLAVFPGDADEIDYDRRRTRGFALATDGLLLGTAVMTAISLYLTFRDPALAPRSLRLAVAVAADRSARRALGGDRAGLAGWCCRWRPSRNSNRRRRWARTASAAPSPACACTRIAHWGTACRCASILIRSRPAGAGRVPDR